MAASKAEASVTYLWGSVPKLSKYFGPVIRDDAQWIAG